MSIDLDITIKTENNVRVCIDKWDDGGAWLFLQGRQASMSTTLTRDEVQQLINGLQLILAQEVSA